MNATRKFIKNLILCIVTFGIWNYVWQNDLLEFSNKIEYKNNNYNQITRNLFLPPFLITWFIKVYPVLDKESQKNPDESN